MNQKQRMSEARRLITEAIQLITGLPMMCKKDTMRKVEAIEKLNHAMFLTTK